MLAFALRALGLRLIAAVLFRITAFVHIVGTPFIYLGFDSEVKVFNTKSRELTAFEITIKDCNLDEEMRSGHFSTHCVT